MNFDENKQLQLAYNFVHYTGRNIFLTGKAGTGKTTFLRFLKENSPKRMVVVAPTGVAAINAGGVTIHSFFQLSFGPQLPEEIMPQSNKFDKNKHRFRKNKINIIRSLDLIVIDEISMVRADLLDGIDRILRRYRNNNQPFGGIQLLMIGDLQQLSPVAKDNEWNLLRPYYDTPYFFSSIALKKTDYVTIELQRVYRQQDIKFINLLNKLRENTITHKTINEINKRYIPDFDIEKEGFIILTTHNYKANKINSERLEKLSGKEKKFKAFINGNFPEYIYPTEKELILKEGAQVMFVKNDPSPEKLFYNGKIGKITEINKSHILVKCEDDDEPIKVQNLVWEKTKYEIDEKTKEVKEELEGTFTQIPLKLAWAITIHKSQGLTFDNVIIDANEAFAHGQVYVALSRCRSLEGIVLKTPITPFSIKHDIAISKYSKYFEENQPNEKTLKISKKDYEKTLLTDLFRFDKLQKNLFYLIKLTSEYSNVIQNNPLEKLRTANETIKIEIIDVSKKFEKQLLYHISISDNIETYAALQDRVKKASYYFSDKIKKEIIELIEGIAYDTDNKEAEKSIDDTLEKMYKEAIFKLKCLETCKKGFVIKNYLDTKAKAAIEEVKPKKKKAAAVDTNIPHPELYKRLIAWRNATAKDEGKPVYMVLKLNSIVDLCKKLPVTFPALNETKGFGKVRIEQYGKEIINVISDYCDETGIKPPEFIPKPPKQKKPDTKKITYEMWKQGLKPEKIAEKRELAVSTIEGHLANYIAKGEIDISLFMEKEKVEKIAEYFRNNDSKSLTDVKTALNDEYSYSELRYVLNYLIFKEEI